MFTCDDSTWSSYACPSCNDATCNWKNAKVGDACPRSSTGDGWCPSDGRSIRCYWSTSEGAGTFVETNCGKCEAGKTTDEIGGC